jgi:single-strand DNA-binding protein
MNKDLKTGRLVDDLERSETRGGTVVAKGRLAVDNMGQGGGVGYINIESYGKGAEAALNTIGKGWLVAVDGRLQYDEWTDKESGARRHDYKLVGDIEFLASPRGNSEGREQQADKTAERQADAEQEADSALNSATNLEPADAKPVTTGAAMAGAGAEL